MMNLELWMGWLGKVSKIECTRIYTACSKMFFLLISHIFVSWMHLHVYNTTPNTILLVPSIEFSPCIDFIDLMKNILSRFSLLAYWITQQVHFFFFLSSMTTWLADCGPGTTWLETCEFGCVPAPFFFDWVDFVPFWVDCNGDTFKIVQGERNALQYFIIIFCFYFIFGSIETYLWFHRTIHHSVLCCMAIQLLYAAFRKRLNITSWSYWLAAWIDRWIILACFVGNKSCTKLHVAIIFLDHSEVDVNTQKMCINELSCWCTITFISEKNNPVYSFCSCQKIHRSTHLLSYSQFHLPLWTNHRQAETDYPTQIQCYK